VEPDAGIAPHLFGEMSLPQLVLAGLLIVAMALLVYRGGQRRAGLQAGGAGEVRLSEAERAAALQRVRDWMGEGAPSHAAVSFPRVSGGEGGRNT
jgi:flagellar M-ring protein FliF